MPRIEATEVAPGFYRPLVTIGLTVNGRIGQSLAVVDSGADRTIIPAEYVVAAGLDYTALPLAPGSQAGAGGQFEARVCPGQLLFREWTFCDEFLAAEVGKLPAILLGREDFFKRFVIRYQWHKTPPIMDIDPIAR